MLNFYEKKNKFFKDKNIPLKFRFHCQLNIKYDLNSENQIIRLINFFFILHGKTLKNKSNLTGNGKNKNMK